MNWASRNRGAEKGVVGDGFFPYAVALDRGPGHDASTRRRSSTIGLLLISENGAGTDRDHWGIPRR